MESEHQQMAAISCHFIDLLADIAEDETLTAEELREQIGDIKLQKDSLIDNPEARRVRFTTLQTLYHLPKPS